jgi:hypothetical protein
LGSSDILEKTYLNPKDWGHHFIEIMPRAVVVGHWDGVNKKQR